MATTNPLQFIQQVRAEVAKVVADTTITDKQRNSKVWALKNKVRKAAIKAGTLKPAS